MKQLNNETMRQSASPLVSVIMPAYNAENYIREAIDSILNQTYKNFELIIVNDASTDSTPTILESYRKQHPKRITVVNLPVNLNGGGDSCANKAIEKAKGKYIARMDADDIALPTRLEKQVAFLEKNKQITVVGSNVHVINETGVITGEKVEPLTSEAIRKAYFTFHPLVHPSCMYRRLIDGKPFRYRTERKDNIDYYTFFSLLAQGHNFANIEEKLLYYRIHSNNYTFRNLKYKYINTMRIRLEMVRTYHIYPTVKAVISNLVQGAIILLLPEKILVQIYLVLKGINKPMIKFPAFRFTQKVKLTPQVASASNA